MRRVFLSVMIGLSALAVGRPHGQAAVAEIGFESAANVLKMPADVYLGEVAGVATDSKGQIFVYTRTGNPTVGLGNSRLFAHGGSRLFQFDAHGSYVREIGQGIYGFLVAHSVRVDAQDNIWIVDEGSNQVVKFGQDGRVLLILGRKPEAITVRTAPSPAGPGAQAEGGGRGGVPGAGGAGDQFTRPADVAWDGAGNILVADGHGPNARIAKFDPSGRFLASWGSKGAGQGQFDAPHSLAVDASGNVYVADPGNKRIEVLDSAGAFKAQITDAGTPTALCLSRGSHPYLYSAHTGDPYGMDDAAIYKMELDGRIVGRFGKAGKQLKEFGLVNSIDCRTEGELYIGELANWRVQKISLRGR
jgi:hypothetical protein